MFTMKLAVTFLLMLRVRVVGEALPERSPLHPLKRYLAAGSASIAIVVPQAQLPELGVMLPCPTTALVSVHSG
jgi:hypothetical protein